MDCVNLVVKYRLAGSGTLQIKGVTRITVDGRGSLIFYDVQTDSTERIDLGQLQSLSLESVDQALGQPN
jgi:hypothetical protein